MSRSFDVPEAIPLSEQVGQTYSSMVLLMRRLLAPDGCPWDREQTFETLRQYVLEEACEVIDAIESGDPNLLREELGDLAFEVVFLSEIAREKGLFGPDDVFAGLITKLVRRHPHVFGDGSAPTASDVERNWDMIKAEEKKSRPLLDNIPRALPALLGARRVSERVASVGFDWDDRSGSREKIREELAELDEAVDLNSPAAMEHELGDLLFAIVNFGRHLGIDPERALRKTTDRFRSRFSHVESQVRQRHGDWPREGTKATRGIPLEELDGYWNEAKSLEKAGSK
jgi:tetrapyrrole methylase family protein/MazG family protein/ATP diphosphatase